MNPFFIDNEFLFLLILLWTIFWKGCAVWFAAKEDKKVWFWVLLIVNLLGILEIIYIFGVAKKKWSDVKALFVKERTEVIENKETGTDSAE